MQSDEPVPPENPVKLNLIPAGIGKRIINYFTDIIIFSILASFIIRSFFPGLLDSFSFNSQKEVSLSTQLLIRFFYGLYMSFAEAIFKGKTIGKLISGTCVVYANDGSTINSQAAFVRGLCRIIPLEELSAIGFPPHPWHDRWSGTIVIIEKDLLAKKRL